MAKLDSATIAGGGVTIASAIVTGVAANADSAAIAGYDRAKGAQVIACIDLTDLSDEQASLVAAGADNKIRLSVDMTAKTLLLIWTQRA